MAKFFVATIGTLLLLTKPIVSIAESYIAAAGLVEPKGEERIIIAEATGKLKHVYISEGDVVEKNQLLAEVENAEQVALVDQAKALVTLREAQLQKLQNGARPEQHREAEAAVAQAQAERQMRQQELTRLQQLYKQNQISQQLLEQAQAQQDAMAAQLERSNATLEQINNGARKEDLAIGKAQLQRAQAELTRAQALFEKTQIRSPISGFVLKRELREGESVTALNPLPLARIGDMQQLFIRAEIDELDITRVAVGQQANISADAFAGQQFQGKIVYVARRMGRRQVRSDNPAQQQDTRVLEVLIVLEGMPAIPIGLRVDVKIAVADAATDKQSQAQ